MNKTGIALVLAALAGCRDGGPGHLTHDMVGTYDVQASYTLFTAPSGTSNVNASLTGTVVIADTVEYNALSDQYFFPEVQITAVFCSNGCMPTEVCTGITSLPKTNPVTIGCGGIHFHAPFENGGFSGTARYYVGGDMRFAYVGTFVATKK